MTRRPWATAAPDILLLASVIMCISGARALALGSGATRPGMGVDRERLPDGLPTPTTMPPDAIAMIAATIDGYRSANAPSPS